MQFIPNESDWGRTGEALGGALVQGYANRSDERALQEAIQGLGENPNAQDVLNTILGAKTYSPNSKQNFLSNYVGIENLQRMKQESAAKAQTKEDVKAEEKVGGLQGALNILDEMNKISERKNIGVGSGLTKYASNQTAYDVANYERLGKSLIQYSTNIPIRNRQEFEALAHDLYDPTKMYWERRGILDAMKKIIGESLNAVKKEVPGEQKQSQPTQKVRVRNKQTGKTGLVTPFEGFEAKYERI